MEHINILVASFRATRKINTTYHCNDALEGFIQQLSAVRGEISYRDQSCFKQKIKIYYYYHLNCNVY